MWPSDLFWGWTDAAAVALNALIITTPGATPRTLTPPALDATRPAAPRHTLVVDP